jgi:hypothetical protein
MQNQELEIFIHKPGMPPRSIQSTPGEVLRDVLIRFEVIEEKNDDVLVFVGEWEEAVEEELGIDDGADQHSPVDATLTLEVLKVDIHRHVHCHTCRHVAAQVNFSGQTKHHKFSPATTVGVVTRWARRKFRLDPVAAADYVLQLCGTSNQPRSNQHLGELVDGSTCSLCFDFVKEVTPQG